MIGVRSRAHAYYESIAAMHDSLRDKFMIIESHQVSPRLHYAIATIIMCSSDGNIIDILR